MAVEWSHYEEKAARWANILAFFPGAYCAYVVWQSRHPSRLAIDMLSPFFLSAASFCGLVSLGSLLNMIRERKGKKSFESIAACPTVKEAPLAPPLLDETQTRALNLAVTFDQMLRGLPPCPEISMERAYGSNPQQTAQVLEEELQVRDAWEQAASRGYARLAGEIDAIIDDFADRGVHVEELDRLRNGSLPREEFVQVPKFLRYLMAESLR